MIELNVGDKVTIRVRSISIYRGVDGVKLPVDLPAVKEEYGFHVLGKDLIAAGAEEHAFLPSKGYYFSVEMAKLLIRAEAEHV